MMQSARQQQLAMIFVPWQEYETLMAPAEALLRGTVFCNLAQTYVPIMTSPVTTQVVASAPNMTTMPNMHTMNNMPLQNMNMQKKR